MARPTFHPLRVADVRHETADAVSIAFEVPSELAPAFSFHPGQYLTLRRRFDGEDLRRSYSICSGVDDHELRVAVKLVPLGRFSAWVNSSLVAGDTVEVMTPMGRFGAAVELGAPRHYLAVAAGSGITPVMSIVRSVLGRSSSSSVTLVYGNRGVSSILFREELEDLKDRYLSRLRLVHVLSREATAVPLFSGRIDAAKVTALGPVLDLHTVDEAFLCGPEPMAEAARDALVALGLDPARVHVELFGAVAPPVAGRAEPMGDGVKRLVTVVLGGIRTKVAVDPAEPVLDAGLRAGLDLPYSCTGGVCATCRAQVRDGEVEMAVNHALEPWELDRGFRLTCQSRVVSDSVTVDYDAS